MSSGVRALLLAIAAVQAVLAIAFVFQVSPVTGLWPFPGTTPLSNIFIGSILAAAAASTAWCVWVGSGRALVGIALDYVTILIPAAVVGLLAALGGGGLGMAGFGAFALGGALIGCWLLRYGLGKPWRDPRPLPRLVRWSFVFFIVALVLVGGALAVRVPNVLPWSVTPELSTLFGLMFLSAAVYFVFGLVEPRWENAGGQLAGFLAYDLVLIVPFAQRLPAIEDELRLNLVIYTVVVVVSGVLAAWYLFLDGRTRLRLSDLTAGPARAAAPTADELA